MEESDIQMPDEGANDEMQSAGRPAGEAPAASEGEDQVADELAALKQECGDLESRLLRVSADYNNFVRRSQQNIATAREQQAMEMTKALVPVLDHFDRALQVTPEASTQTVLQGVEMVRGELLRTLERFGVRRIEASVGEPFDPTRHEAVVHQQAPGVEPNHVSMQLEAGYMVNDKTLRPAKVAVAP